MKFATWLLLGAVAVGVHSARIPLEQDTTVSSSPVQTASDLPSEPHEFERAKMEFTQTTKPIDLDMASILGSLNPAHTFEFYIPNEKGEAIAGCSGSVYGGSIYTNRLWVLPQHRQLGLGLQLMEAVHEHGRKHRCTTAFVATTKLEGVMGFYQKMGYSVAVGKKGHSGETSSFMLSRAL